MSNRSLVTLLALSALSLGLGACHNDDDDPPPAAETPTPLPTYSVGGTVAGSTGSLTLQNSVNADILTVPAAGAFTFATRIHQGASYNVVAAPPNGQTCTVTNGSGIMGISNITNVAVSCTNNTLTLGGTVSGLAAGRTLVLRVDSDAAFGTRSITANGAFSFGVAFLPNAEYEVNVQTQPTGQTCSLANATGDFASADIGNVAVTCINSSASNRDWQPSQVISEDVDPLDANGILKPRVAYDAAGNALAVWEADQVGGSSIEILWSRKPAGGNWTTPAVVPAYLPPSLDPAIGEARRDPVLAVAPNGNAVVAWRGMSFLGAHVFASTYTPATGWSEPEFLFRKHPDAPSGAVDLRIASDSNGNTLLVWAEAGTIDYNRYTPGVGWVLIPTTEGFARLVSDLIGPASEPEMAMNAAGQAVAIWRQGRQSFPDLPHDWDLFSSRYDMATDTWTAPQQVEDGERDVFYGKSVVIDAAGAVTAVWSDYDGDRTHIRSARMSGNVWTLPSIVESGNTSETGFAMFPMATVDGSGNVMVVWQQGDVDVANFVATRHVPDTAWGGQQVIGHYMGSSSPIFGTEMSMAGNAAGHVVVLWTLPGCLGPENVPCPTDVLANEYNPVNGNWGAEQVIDKHYEFPGEVNGDASTPYVAVDAAGNAVAVWDQDNSGVGDGIRAAVFE